LQGIHPNAVYREEKGKEKERQKKKGESVIQAIMIGEGIKKKATDETNGGNIGPSKAKTSKI
jgi:hypothetical protein